MMTERVLILGAAGRDFHNFNVFFRDNPNYTVVAFTATQIPYIENRHYPPSLAGPLYPAGIPIFAEEQLERLIAERKVDLVLFSYSDVSYEHVMHTSARVMAAGASFWLLGPEQTMLAAAKPVTKKGSSKKPAAKTTKKPAQKKK